MKKLILFVFSMIVLMQLASAAVVKIDSDKILNIDGVRTFPIFASDLSNDRWRTASSGISESSGYITASWVTWRPNVWNIDPWSANAMLPYYEATNPKVYTTSAIMKCPSVDSMKCYLQTQPNVKNSPAFLGYVQIDEPAPSRGIYDDINVLQNNYNVIHADDPNHPVFINFYATPFDNWPGIDYYINTADVLSWDRYKLTNSVNRPDFQYVWEFGSIKAFGSKKLTDYSKPFYTAIDVLGQESAQDTLVFYVPTPQEVRLEMYGAITTGVNGIILWPGRGCCDANNNDNGLLSNPILFASVKNLLSEIHSFNDILIMPTVGNSVWNYYDDTTVSFSPNPSRVVDGGYGTMRAFSYILKKDPISGTLYLIVVNKDASPQNGITMHINGLSGVTTAITIGMETSGSARAGRKLDVLNGQFIDSFDGFAVHIYQIGAGNYVPPVPIPVPTSTPNPTNVPPIQGVLVTDTIQISPMLAGIVQTTSDVGSNTIASKTILTIPTNSQVTYKAISISGFKFDHFLDTWNGGVYTTTQNPWTDTMGSNDIVTAVFVPSLPENVQSNVPTQLPGFEGIFTIGCILVMFLIMRRW